jgi:hypothetical protein
MLQSHERMRQLQHREPLVAQKLVRTIVSRASGVFLWVVVVVRSLTDGFSDGSYLHELDQILDGYPAELHELYEHMFQRMKLDHRVQASKLFQSVFRAIEVEKYPPTALRLYFTDEGDPASSLHLLQAVLSVEESYLRLITIEDRLRSRCCGLFTVRQRPQSETTNSPDEGQVALLHRSVLDFWKEPKIRDRIESETQNTNFDPSEGLLASILFQAKTLYYEKPWNSREKFAKTVQAFLTH